MTKIDQLPAELHVEIVQGDAWRVLIDFNIDLTGFDIAALIQPKAGGDPVNLTVNEIDLSLGQFEVALPVAASGNLPPAYHTWCLTMTPPFVEPALPETRTYFSGRFIVQTRK